MCRRLTVRECLREFIRDEKILKVTFLKTGLILDYFSPVSNTLLDQSRKISKVLLTETLLAGLHDSRGWLTKRICL
ncbi:hypothetical protein BPOR_0498g00070 [Botrytis porri]|uniref:Uncharacterized protein n=1 Tax=Botrytis porri TaxID=87229 RepID=A0A4Z1KEL7_9HELO|nr:hypothetical protein BPOR_0498g00070 [Botrytis porri]